MSVLRTCDRNTEPGTKSKVVHPDAESGIGRLDTVTHIHNYSLPCASTSPSCLPQPLPPEINSLLETQAPVVVILSRSSPFWRRVWDHRVEKQVRYAWLGLWNIVSMQVSHAHRQAIVRLIQFRKCFWKSGTRAAFHPWCVAVCDGPSLFVGFPVVKISI